MADRNIERERLSKIVISEFLESLPGYSGLPPQRIALVVDGVRRAIYDATLRNWSDTYYAVMREHFIERARSLGYEVIDLHAVFDEDYRANRTRFEFDDDWHWNGYGHAVVARAIENSWWMSGVRAGQDNLSLR